jgi:hypothetical protein
MHRLLTAPLIATVALIITGSAVSAQNAFPAPLPGQVGQPPANSGAPSATIVTPPAASFPSTGAPPIGAIGSTQMRQASAECADGYAHLRDEAENRRKLIAAARERRAPPDEACKLLTNYLAAEAKLIKYVEANAATCAIPAQIANQLNANRRRTADLQLRACTLARDLQKHAPAGPTGDFWPTSTDAPI